MVQKEVLHSKTAVLYYQSACHPEAVCLTHSTLRLTAGWVQAEKKLFSGTHKPVRCIAEWIKRISHWMLYNNLSPDNFSWVLKSVIKNIKNTLFKHKLTRANAQMTHIQSKKTVQTIFSFSNSSPNLEHGSRSLTPVWMCNTWYRLLSCTVSKISFRHLRNI